MTERVGGGTEVTLEKLPGETKTTLLNGGSKEGEKRQSDRIRDKTRLNLRCAFTRWRELWDFRGFKTDIELALFVLINTSSSFLQMFLA